MNSVFPELFLEGINVLVVDTTPNASVGVQSVAAPKDTAAQPVTHDLTHPSCLPESKYWARIASSSVVVVIMF